MICYVDYQFITSLFLTFQVIYFFGQTVSSYILAFMVSVMFEAPVVTMLKILSPSRKKRV